MTTKPQGLAIIKDKKTGLKFLATQFFDSKSDVRVRYPKPDYAIVQFPVIFTAPDGMITVDQGDGD